MERGVGVASVEKEDGSSRRWIDQPRGGCISCSAKPEYGGAAATDDGPSKANGQNVCLVVFAVGRQTGTSAAFGRGR